MNLGTLLHGSSQPASATGRTIGTPRRGALSFPAASFDAVVSSLTMHHLDAADQLPAVREMRRVLKPGGRLLIAEFQAPHGFSEIQLGDVAPVLKYVRAVNGPS
jgi:ubiquinone/menaquinone biosynthesis C-methylase UbiE